MEYRTTGTRSRLLYLPLHHILSSSGEGCEQQIYQCSDAILFFLFFKAVRKNMRWTTLLWFVFTESMKWSIWDLNITEDLKE